MPRPGTGYRTHTTGLTHGPDGFPTQDPAQVSAAMHRLLGKLERRRDEIDAVQALHTEDAEVLVVAVGIVARAAERAVRLARQDGLRAGFFRPVTLWPFPESALREAALRCQAVLVAEMNAGQLALEVARVFHGRVERLNRLDGEPIDPAEILKELRRLVPHA